MGRQTIDNIESPDPRSIQRFTADGVPVSEIQVKWLALPRKHRLRRWFTHRKYVQEETAARAAIEAGGADRRARRLAEKGRQTQAGQTLAFRLTTPEPRWVARMTLKGAEPDQVHALWMSMHSRRRLGCWSTAAARAKTHERKSKEVADGTAKPSTITYVRNGGFRIHRTREEGTIVLKTEAKERDSSDRLAFHLEYTKGCSVADCPLAVGQWFSLLQHIHVDPATKVGSISQLLGTARLDELQKTECLCLWHAYIKSHTASSSSSAASQVVQWKIAHGCEHPCHAQMSYAPLVPSTTDPRLAGFLHVSHLLRGVAREERTSDRALVHDLQAGRAVVHCKFCHWHWTTCEDAHLTTAALTVHESEQLVAGHPEFVEHFEAVTDGFDWAAEKERVRLRVIQRRDKEDNTEQHE